MAGREAYEAACSQIFDTPQRLGVADLFSFFLFSVTCRISYSLVPLFLFISLFSFFSFCFLSH
ncbi:hypothetical protein, partial [Streptomyces thioluteus]|uniref:hypothetical protein n=1 Tax=Streptomyces thioluteus TaxID=66431 RepID=UPI0031E59CAE